MVDKTTDNVTEQAAKETATENTANKADFAQVVQKQITELKQEFTQRVESLKSQFPLSQDDLIKLKDKLSAEIAVVLEDVTKVSKEIKQDITDISLKHKDQIADTFSHAKETVVDVLQSINLSQAKDAETPAEKVVEEPKSEKTEKK